ncbi:molybdate ABC transporter substrate-binding protein [Sediminihaliea albiluteola]|uniref:molybdate ABC transporter substrate-binding protein n=1 Tax=Sediminihaliea albiluteola TaxID=2758564 RepID=UPI0015F3E190|nr:molybdate ABC transporter substrate-binding protein [Sediminihaliea albiluteola]
MRYLWLFCLCLALPCWSNETLRVAVAANFRPVLEQINPEFEAAQDTTVLLSSASTGVLHNQIRYGAPFDILLAADSDTPAILEQEGFTLPGQRYCYALGRLVLLGASDWSALADPRQSLAIANPTTAPYGRAAEEVLSRDEFQAGHKRKLVLGNNAVQTWQFWHSGGVNLALVPQSLSLDAGLLVPQQWHNAIEQQAVLLPRAADKPQAQAYLKWLLSPAVRQQIRQYGYDNCL